MPAGLAWARGDDGADPVRIAEFAEDLAQPVVDFLEDGRPLGDVNVLKRGEPRDGRVDAGIARRGESRPRPFCIHCVFLSSGALPSRVNGTALPGARRTMTSAEECRVALQKLAGRLAELNASERDQYFGNRTISVTIPDLHVTFVSRLGAGDDVVREAAPGEPPADIKLTANSGEVVALSEQPMNIARAWVTGRVKIEASMKDLFRLRRLL